MLTKTYELPKKGVLLAAMSIADKALTSLVVDVEEQAACNPTV